MRNLYRLPLSGGALLLLLTPLFANDSERDRKARAALALAAPAKVAIATAPAPRAAVTRDYNAGVKAAVDAEKPLVVYVGCPGQNDVPGAVVAKADALGDVKAPAVVVGFPVGERLYIHATLDCPVTDAKLAASVKAAAKKVGEPAPREMPAPKALDWDVRSEPSDKPAVGSCVMIGEDLAKKLGLLKGSCDCGNACPCGAKTAKQADSPKADPTGACVRVAWDRFGASGVCVACEGGKSLVVSNNHVFTEKRTPFGEFARADYPLACSVRTLDGKLTLKAIAVDGDKDADLAFLVVDGELPVAEMAASDAPVGTKVWHRGVGSGGGYGKVLPVQQHPQAKQMFASDCSSESGDSGAGVFDPNGRLVAINCGRHSVESGSAQRGTPITPVRNLLRGTAQLAFPNMAAKLRGAPQSLPAAAPAEKPPVAKVAGGKVIKWQGQPLIDQSPNGLIVGIKNAWPGGATIETADAIDYYPPSHLMEAFLDSIRETGPVTIITPGGGTKTVTVEGQGGVSGSRSAPSACPGGVCPTGVAAPRHYTLPAQPSCPNGRCPLQR